MGGANDWTTVDISIHAPHTGRDGKLRKKTIKQDISIHAPHTGRDHAPGAVRTPREKFQSTRPIRGATFSKGYLSF